MRQLRVDFTQDNPCVDGHVLGRIGEHNATELIITPPADIAAHEAVVSYIIAFSVSNMIIHTKPFEKSETVTVPLWKQLTQEPVIGVQLEAYDSDGEFIGKSEYLSGLRFTPSACGDDTPADSDNHDLLSQVVQNTEKSHLHDNKKVIDGFSEKDGVVMYNGKQITGSGTGLSEKQLADLNANTEARHSHENKRTLDRLGVSAENVLTFDGKEVGPAEAETATIEITSDNLFGVVENAKLTLMAFDGLPENKEIVSVELNIPTLNTVDDDGNVRIVWIDIRDMIELDNIPYVINGRKTFMHTEQGFVCFGVVYFLIKINQFAQGAEASTLSARITYKI